MESSARSPETPTGRGSQHPMPFGAEVLPDGWVRFRLWAPSAREVEVSIVDTKPEIGVPMAREDDGWFEAVTAEAQAGRYYEFRIDDGLRVPDPASRAQPEDVHQPSLVVDPRTWRWTDGDWRGRPWEDAVFYELHVGSFSPEGTFLGAARRLDHLVELGVTAIELMPIAEFPGRRGWGYDGAALFAPESAYGDPDDLKFLVQAAHERGLMVFLDVVYNHFGPEGNYLHLYAPRFFTERHKTPWGAAIDFDGPESHWVRRFFIHNALYWLEEFHIDGLRLDAVHAIIDDSEPDILEELADVVRAGVGRRRHVHLVLENDHNAAHRLARDDKGMARHYTAQWNDDAHHALHVLLTGETQGYYADYADDPARHLGRCLAEGFAYQGEISEYRGGVHRGAASGQLPPTAFVNFLQNHDQIGNRALGNRIGGLAPPAAIQAATAVLLLAPSPPLLFMGQEWGSGQPFLFFCDFGPDLAGKVTAGRRREFAHCPEFATPEAQNRIPDPTAADTFEACRLDWDAPDTAGGREWLDFHRGLLALRHREITPRLAGIPGGCAGFVRYGAHGLGVHWRLGEGSRLNLLANLGPAPLEGVAWPEGRLILALPGETREPDAHSALPAWSVVWSLQDAL